MFIVCLENYITKIRNEVLFFMPLNQLVLSIVCLGYVVANDADNKRCYLMTHQVGRLCSANFIIMNMDASNLPSFATKVCGIFRSAALCASNF